MLWLYSVNWISFDVILKWNEIFIVWLWFSLIRRCVKYILHENYTFPCFLWWLIFVLVCCLSYFANLVRNINKYVLINWNIIPYYYYYYYYYSYHHWFMYLTIYHSSIGHLSNLTLLVSICPVSICLVGICPWTILQR